MYCVAKKINIINLTQQIQRYTYTLLSSDIGLFRLFIWTMETETLHNRAFHIRYISYTTFEQLLIFFGLLKYVTHTSH